jgi:hypothetical protein
MVERFVASRATLIFEDLAEEGALVCFAADHFEFGLDVIMTLGTLVCSSRIKIDDFPVPRRTKALPFATSASVTAENPKPACD